MSGLRAISGLGAILGLRSKIRMELDLLSRQQQDFDSAFFGFGEFRPARLHGPTICRGVGDLDWTAAAQLELVSRGLSRRQVVDAKAGAGIIDFKQANRRAGAIFYCDLKGMGVTACEKQHGGQEQSGLQLRPPSELAASFFSSRSRRLSSSGSRWKMVTARSQTRLSKPGEPEIVFPAGMSWEIPL